MLLLAVHPRVLLTDPPERPSRALAPYSSTFRELQFSEVRHEDPYEDPQEDPWLLR